MGDGGEIRAETVTTNSEHHRYPWPAIRQSTSGPRQYGTDYTPEQERSLTDAILDAIEECIEEDLLEADFVRYDDIDPEALDALFRHDAQPRTTVTFNTDHVLVELWGDGGVVIEVSKQASRD